MAGTTQRLAQRPARGTGLRARRFPRVPGQRERAGRVSTPRRLRRMLAWLILATLAWGVLASFTASLHASGAGTVVTASEPLTFDAQQIWTSLSDANDQASAAILAGGLPPQSVVSRYNQDLQVAKLDIVDAAARGGPMADLNPLSAGLTSYDTEVATALADNRLGYPLGAAYLRQASAQMTGYLLPRANALYVTEDAELTTASAQATGLPLMVVTVLAGLGLGYAYYRAGRWLTGRTHRVLNGGLVLAGAAGALALIWLVAAFVVGRADLLTAQAQGSAPVTALADADIAVLKAHAAEALTLINNAGDDTSEATFQDLEKKLGPGPGTLLTLAQSDAAGSPAAASAAAAAADASAWYAQHQRVRQADDRGDHLGAVSLVLGGTAGSAFQKLSGDIGTGIKADNLAFASHARDGQGAFSGLLPGMIIVTLVMAAGVAWGLSRRLAEYR